MSLDGPNLDDRTFQQIVDEAKRMIPQMCPDWTDHNVHDPGVTLIELLAWMTEMIIYRLNRVPRKNYIKFLELIGVQLHPGSAAETEITFKLTGPQPQPFTIPAGTQVSTVRTEAEEAIVFSTEEALTIAPPRLDHCLVTRNGQTYQRIDDRLFQTPPAGGYLTSFLAFDQPPRETNAFCLGFRDDLSGLLLMLEIHCDPAQGTGVRPDDAPLVWEYLQGTEWFPFRGDEVLMDTTGGLNRAQGRVILQIPLRLTRSEVNLERGFWVRCRSSRPRRDQATYDSPPSIRHIRAYAVGGTARASHCITIHGEVLGRSKGEPGQFFYTRNKPILPRREGEVVEVQREDGQFEPWIEVEDFSASGPQDPHYMLDAIEGELRFGPSLAQPNGERRQYGKIPPPGREIRFRAYRYGGGSKGRLARNTLTVLKSSIPYVDSVTNRRPTMGGADPESLENAMLRARRLLRVRNRAVTADDFEFLAGEATSGVQRAQCMHPGEQGRREEPLPGTVRVVIVPSVPGDPDRLTPRQITPTPALIQRVQAYLDERRLLTTVVQVAGPQYIWVATDLRIVAEELYDPQEVCAAVRRRLFQFINPIGGGPEGNGWPFGESLRLADVYGAAQRVPGVAYVRTARLFLVESPADPRAVQKPPPNAARIDLPPDGLFCSYEHEVMPVPE